MLRGEVWWANLPAPADRRPVVLLTRDSAYNYRTSVTIAPITRTIREMPAEVSLGPEDGLPANCIINLDDITTISKSRLTDRITMLSRDKLNAVTKAVIFALDLRV
jgi:mRNA interferase MazF